MGSMKPFLVAAVLGVLCACSVEGGEDPGPTGGGSTGTDAAPAMPPDAGAPTGDLENYCNEFAAAICTKLFTCMTAEERDAAGVPPTEEECVVDQQDGCATSSSAELCPEGEVYHSDQALPCVTQFVALTCEQFLDPDSDAVLALHAPACAALCR